MTTSRTSTTGVPRINQTHRHASTFRFVGHKSPKLVERPTMQGCPLTATNRNPLPNTLQIFQGNRSTCVFRFGNQLLADAMVGVFGKTVFFPREPLEFTFGRPCASGLQFGAQAAVTMTYVVDVAGRVDLPVAIYGDIRYSQVNAQYIFHVNRLWLIHLASGRQKEHPFVQLQVTFPLPGLKQFQLPFSTDKRDAKPPIHRPYRNGLVLQSPGQDAVIVGNTARWLERAFGFVVEFVSVRNFGNRPHRNLSRQPKLFPHRLIELVMQIVLPKGIGFPGGITHELASRIGLFQRVSERGGLFGCREQFNLGNKFYALDYSTNALNFQPFKLFLKEVGFLHPLKRVVSAG